VIDYRCRACGWWLLASNATAGKITVYCPNRRCGKKQDIWLGKPERAAELRRAPAMVH
jgi:phage FluMu protein Com